MPQLLIVSLVVATRKHKLLVKLDKYFAIKSGSIAGKKISVPANPERALVTGV